MNLEVFEIEKNKLLLIIQKGLSSTLLSENDKIELEKLDEILNNYTFGNRMYYKGLMTRVIIDSFDLQGTIGDEFIQFDNAIR